MHTQYNTLVQRADSTTSVASSIDSQFGRPPAPERTATKTLAYRQESVPLSSITMDDGSRQYSSNGMPGEEIRTLYVVGLPDDVRERELRNLFRFYPAFRGSMLSEKKGKYGGTLAFALFESKAAALEAKAVLDNTPFDQADPDGPKLSLHLAKKNINPRMLRETRLLTQHSQPAGSFNGGYNERVMYNNGGYGAHGGSGWAPNPPPMRNSYQSPGPVGYGAPSSGGVGVLGPSSVPANGAGAFLGMDPYDNPIRSGGVWQEQDQGLPITSPWHPVPGLDSPVGAFGPPSGGGGRGNADQRRYRTSQSHTAHFASPPSGLYTDAFAQ